jgi:2-methylcitrate dehydratase PrpD
VSASSRLAAYTAELAFDELPIPVQRRARELVLDHIGVGIRGSLAESSSALRAYLVRQPSGDATVLGSHARSRAAYAALVNGASAHATEMDDVERASVLHPGAPVVGAALAVAEERDRPLGELFVAVVAGYEVMMRVGLALNPGNAYKRGFHPTGVAGVFGATVAAGRLIGLDARGLTHALGAAGSMASGSLAYLTDGSWTKRLNAGWAGFAGVTAAEIAEAGFTGPSEVFESDVGVLHAYSDGARPELLVDGLGADHAIMRVAIKPYGCCRWVHALVDAMFELRRQGVEPADVERIDVWVLTIGERLVSVPLEQKRAPRTVVDAQFSAPFAAALALVRGSAGVEDFSDANIADPVIQRLAARTVCHTAASMDATYPAKMPGRVELKLRDGRTVSAAVDHPKGEPENPLSGTELRQRFVDLATPVLERDSEAFAIDLLESSLERPVRTVTARLRRADVTVR